MPVGGMDPGVWDVLLKVSALITPPLGMVLAVLIALLKRAISGLDARLQEAKEEAAPC